MATYLDHKIHATVQTTDGTVTTCGSYTLADETSVFVTAIVFGRQASSTNANAYLLVAAVKRESAGGATQITGSPIQERTFEDAGTWDAVIDVSSNDVRIRVTGVAATTINWDARIEVQVFTP